MSRIFVFLLCAVAAAAAPPQAGPARTVYLLQMGSGFDQYLANHLAAAGALDVVTDAKRAETVLTDRLGPGFETRMKDLYPEARPEAKPEKDAKSDKTEAGDLIAAMGSAKATPVGTVSSFGRSKGNLFLVDAKTRQVIWSTYERPAGASPEDLDRAATRVVSRFQKEMQGKVKPPRAPTE